MMVDLPHQVGVLKLCCELLCAVASVCLSLFVTVTICVTGVTLEFLILNSHCVFRYVVLYTVFYTLILNSHCVSDLLDSIGYEP